MTHDEFREAHATGRLRVDIDPKLAARFLSARLLLPLFTMPVLGIGVALALIGWIVTGFLVIALAMAVPRLIKRGAPRFILTHALTDEKLYLDAVAAGALRVARDGAGEG
jgi:hypothetical protein